VIRLPVHAARAFAPVPLLFAACATGGLLLAVHAGLLGLPLFAILASWTAKYFFVLTEASAHGLPPPVLSTEMVNPFDERRPLAALLIVATVAGVVGGVRAYAGGGAADALTYAAVALAPASLIVLAIEGSTFRALDPRACIDVIRALGPTYLALAAFALAYAAGLLLLARTAAPLALVILAGVMLLLSYATLVGGAVHDARLALGLDAVVSPERDAERAAAERARAFEAVATEMYGYVRARKPELAWEAARRWLAGRRALEDWASLLARAETWDDPAVATRLRREYVGRLQALGRRGEALRVVESAWRRGFGYAPASARELTALVQTARDVGHADTADRLLEECGPAFDSDAEVRALRTRAGR
jgi:hypothetical protein